LDAHLFRRVCEALIPRLDGARLEKIQAPAPDAVCLSFYAQRRTLHLLMKYGRRDAFLCGVQERPAAPARPPASIMRLRKHVRGRRVRSCIAHWPQRCLYLLFGGVEDAGGLCPARPQGDTGGTAPRLHEDAGGLCPARPCLLCLDVRSGPRLESGEEQPAGDPVHWPSPEELPRALEEWRCWPALTPALRRTLPLLEEPEQRALLADLATGGGDVFVYGREAECEIFAWPLPDDLREGREERVFTDALEAASLAGTARIFDALAAREREAHKRQERREAERLRRLLAKLDAEEARLRELAHMQREGLALQAQLWRYPPDFRCGELILDSPDGPLCIRPDPRHSLREHMERLFHGAGRGRRGLALLEQRRAKLRALLVRAEAAARPEAGRIYGARAEIAPSGRERDPGALEKGRTHAGLPANVQAFASSDGIVILRGRDAAGNRALLRLADPYDLWMHVEGGPGAHVLVRRGQGREIPRRSLLEAANLALAKSWRRGSAGAGVMCAQARHVRPAKGGKPGAVRVDKVECVLEPALDPDIELRVRRL
jgi:hypothetical protein